MPRTIQGSYTLLQWRSSLLDIAKLVLPPPRISKAKYSVILMDFSEEDSKMNDLASAN